MSKKKEDPGTEVVPEIGPEIQGHKESRRIELGDRTKGMALDLFHQVDVAGRAEEYLKRELAKTFQERQQANLMLEKYLKAVTDLSDEALESGNWVLWSHEDQVFVSEIERVEDSE